MIPPEYIHKQPTGAPNKQKKNVPIVWARCYIGQYIEVKKRLVRDTQNLTSQTTYESSITLLKRHYKV